MEQKKQQAKEPKNKEVFAALLVQLGNPKEAAIAAGYPPEQAWQSAAKLLEDKEVLRKIAKLRRQQEQNLDEKSAVAGLHRLAFGSVNDAVALVMQESVNLDAIATLDLYNVAEIRQLKGGGCEVRFHDRLAALRTLLEYAPRPAGEGELIQALENGTRALERRKNHGD